MKTAGEISESVMIKLANVNAPLDLFQMLMMKIVNVPLECLKMPMEFVNPLKMVNFIMLTHPSQLFQLELRWQLRCVRS